MNFENEVFGLASVYCTGYLEMDCFVCQKDIYCYRLYFCPKISLIQLGNIRNSPSIEAMYDVSYTYALKLKCNANCTIILSSNGGNS